MLAALVLFSSLYFFFIRFSLLDRNAEESVRKEILTDDDDDEMVGDRGRLIIAGSLRSFDVGNRIGATLKSNCEAPPIIRPN